MIQRICEEQRQEPLDAKYLGVVPTPYWDSLLEIVHGFNPHSPIAKRTLFSPSRENSPLLALCDLEFRKAFLILNYTGRRKLEEHMKVDDIMMLKDLPMRDFEMKVWDAVGKDYINKEDRIQVNMISFAGLYDDFLSKCDAWKLINYPKNIVVSSKQSIENSQCIILMVSSVGLHSGIKCTNSALFLCSIWTGILERHIYTTVMFIKMALMLSRFQYCQIQRGPYLGNKRTHLQRELGDDNVLIVKFPVEASDSTNKMVRIAEEEILIGLRRYRFFVFKDGGKEEKKKSQTSVKCFFVRFESLAPCEEREPYILANKLVSEARTPFSEVMELLFTVANADEEGEPLIHTDGTGFISEDLALKTPKDFSRAKYINDGNFQRFLDPVNCEEKSPELNGSEVHTREPPLLMQVRLFCNGLAVKGTLLVNKKLRNTILIRPSMIKVETDSRLINAQSFNSLEIVKISQKPKRTFLSKNLIALLSYGGVPKECFLKILEEELEHSRSAYCKKLAALRAALNHGEIDDDFTVARMILSGVPLNEPYLQHRLSFLAKEERKALKGGRLPIRESFYLMGTTDPTGILESHEVCVILIDNGQISGDLLVYRNPGLHFGDIHRLKAVYVKGLEEIVGNAKYAIFFSTKGERSVANEMANGDFDGDMYWVSRNPELLDSFKVRRPWRRIYSTPSVPSKKPNELSEKELEHELFQLFKKTLFQRSWTAFMDRLLILGDGCADETDRMKGSMHQLVDKYYDALDAPKSGKRDGWILWGERYAEYRTEMSAAMDLKDKEARNAAADAVTNNYKQLLYHAPEFEESKRDVEEIYRDALAIYNVVYEHAERVRDIGKCGFAWKVAGPPSLNSS
ncbi:hypothetical protein C3L33_03610, partial [Rhododendron williamsianum]